MATLELKTGKVSTYYDEKYGEYSEHEKVEVDVSSEEMKIYNRIYEAYVLVEGDFNEDTTQEEYDKYIPLYDLYHEITSDNYKEVLEKASKLILKELLKDAYKRVRKMTKIINMTPHTININEVEIQSSGVVRLQQKTETIGSINGIPITIEKMGEPTNLPPKQAGVLIVVSNIVASALEATRDDLATVGKAIRDDQGRIIGSESIAIRANTDPSLLDALIT